MTLVTSHPDVHTLDLCESELRFANTKKMHVMKSILVIHLNACFNVVMELHWQTFFYGFILTELKQHSPVHQVTEQRQSHGPSPCTTGSASGDPPCGSFCLIRRISKAKLCSTWTKNESTYFNYKWIKRHAYSTQLLLTSVASEMENVRQKVEDRFPYLPYGPSSKGKESTLANR